MRQGAVGLVADPAPRQLHDHATDMRIPRARNALVVVGLAALIRRRDQADQRAEFSTDSECDASRRFLSPAPTRRSVRWPASSRAARGRWLVAGVRCSGRVSRRAFRSRICPSTSCSCVHVRVSRSCRPGGSGVPSQRWAASSRWRNFASIGSDTPCVASSDFSRFISRVRSCVNASKVRGRWRASSSATVGTRTTRHARRSPRTYRASRLKRPARSRRSVLARLARRLTSMLEESTT